MLRDKVQFTYQTRKPHLHSAGLLVWAIGLVALSLVRLTFPGPYAAAVEPSPTADLDGYRQRVEPFLKQNCMKCHGPDKQKGQLALHTLDTNVPSGKDIETWKAIAERLALNEMPPDSEPRPDALAAASALAWIKAELTKGGVSTADAERKLYLPGYGNRVNHEALFSGKITVPAASPARLWRNSPQIYEAFTPRIAGQKQGNKNSKLAQPFSGSSAEGFKDYADLFVIDEPTVSQLLRNALQIVEIQTTKSNLGKPVKEFLILVDSARPPTEGEMKAAINRQFELCLQRKPTADELQRFMRLMEKNVKDAGQVVGAKATLATILMLPEALYRHELGTGKPDAHGRRLLSPRELAYAIAYALTDSGPDATLLKAADTEKLTSASDVRREVERILNDKSIAKPRILRFFEEYFEYPAVQEVFKDLERGKWRPEILVNDTRLLIEYILDQDRNVLKELLTTNKSFVNYKVSKTGPQPAFMGNKNNTNPAQRQLEYHELYGLPADWKWTDKQPIELPPKQRAGILTQPSWLAAFATNNENHAIRRGKWVRERLLGGVVPDLPITVDAQLPDKPELTLRQRMEITKQEYCWQCHQKMNPLGLTFENYDYLGRFRTTERVVDPNVPPKPNPKKGESPIPSYREVPIDATGWVEHSGDPKLDGEVKNAVVMIHNLADSPRVRQVFVRHAFRYWMGRNELLSDAPTLLAADNAYTESGGSMKALITALLTSDSFLYRKP